MAARWSLAESSSRSQQTNITEVPIVGSLPIIGYLFRRTNVSVQSQELLFFITPRIIPG